MLSEKKFSAKMGNYPFRSVSRLSADRCTGCGTCAGVCPRNSVTMVIDATRGVYLPKIDKTSCVDCGVCIEVCPGINSDIADLEFSVFGKHPSNPLLGNFLKCYQGYSNNHKLRFNSSSGGLVTQLLICALEEKLIDGVLVTKMNPNKPLEPQSFIAKKPEEVISASGSKYCPVPLNASLKEILNSTGKYAVVGLPCHLQGIRRAENTSIELKDKIVLHIGIFCSHNLTFHATEYILNQLGLEKKDVKKLRYRGSGWPGSLTVKKVKGSGYSYPYKSFGRMHVLHFFTAPQCLKCKDQSCEFADIALGDAWLPNFVIGDKLGRSLAITRTAVGENLLQTAANKNQVFFQSLEMNQIVKSQIETLLLKKHYYVNKDRGIEKNRTSLSSVLDYSLSLLFSFNSKISSKKRRTMLINFLINPELLLMKGTLAIILFINK